MTITRSLIVKAKFVWRLGKRAEWSRAPPFENGNDPITERHRTGGMGFN
jgi:hypothetical protein